MTVSEGAGDAAAYGWFSPPDLDILFAALTRLGEPGSIVLVGGQSLSFWVDWYDIPIPQTDTPYLTQDADFLASRKDAEELAKHLGGDLRLATIDDLTPNTATVVFDGVKGERLLIDFLGLVVGLTSAEIRTHAVPVARDGQRLFILHPLLCLQSRISNLRQLPAKRNRNGIEQARVAVEVARRYVSERLGNGETRAALKAANKIATMAQSKDGLYVWERWGIDVLQAIVAGEFPDTRFQQIEWPKQVAKTDTKRKKAENRKRQQAEGRSTYATKKRGPL